MRINRLDKVRKNVFSVLIITIFIITSCLTNFKSFFGEVSNEKKTDERIEYYNYYIKSNGPLTPKGIRLTPINESSNSISATWYTEEEASDPKIIYSKESSLINNISLVPTSKNLSKFAYNICNQFNPKFINRFPVKYRKYIYHMIKDMIPYLEMQKDIK